MFHLGLIKHIHVPTSIFSCPWCFPQAKTNADAQGKKHYSMHIGEFIGVLALHQCNLILSNSNLDKITGSIRFPFSNFRHFLTLFSKSFSSFPHGTCLLSVSNLYLALDEIYHPLCAPIPRNVTLRKHAVHKGLQMTWRILTHNDVLFQEACNCTHVGNTLRGYNSRPEAPISMPSLSLFIRHY